MASHAINIYNQNAMYFHPELTLYQKPKLTTKAHDKSSEKKTPS